jgi:hypothetical protein
LPRKPLDDLSKKGAFLSGFSRNDGSGACSVIARNEAISLQVVAVMKLKFLLYVIARNEAISLYFMGAMKNEDSNLREDCLENPLMIFLKKEHFYRGFLAMTALEPLPQSAHQHITILTH